MFGGAKSNLEIILGLTDKTGGFSGVIGNLQKLGTVAIGVAAGGIAAIGAGVIALASKAIPAASDLNEALNASSVVFGDAAKTIQDYGKIAADQAGLSASAFNQMAAQTGAMLTNFGFSNQKAADETIKLTQRSADLASIFNTDVSDALVAVQSLMRGETEPARKFGVSMNQVSVEAKALELGFKKVGKTFDQNALTTARLALFYEQTDKIAGDFVNTSDQLANGARVQKARWENFLATAGTKMLPIITKLQNVFMGLAEKYLPKLLDALDPIIDTVGKLADTFINIIDDIGLGSSPFGAIIDTFDGQLPDAIQNTLIWLDDLWTRFPEVLSDIAEKFSPFTDKLFGIFRQVGDIFSGIVESVKTILPGLLQTVRDVWGKIGPAIDENIQTILTMVSLFLSNIQTWWMDHGTEVMNVVRFIWDNLVVIISGAWLLLTGLLKAGLQLLQGDWEGAWNTVKETLSTIWDTIVSIVGDRWQDIYNSISEWVQKAIKKIGELLSSIFSVQSAAETASGASLTPEQIEKYRTFGRAAGGDVYRGQPYIVGEKGPEGFVPDQNGTIIPNNAMRNMGATYNIYTQDNPSRIIAALRHHQAVERVLAT